MGKKELRRELDEVRKRLTYVHDRKSAITVAFNETCAKLIAMGGDLPRGALAIQNELALERLAVDTAEHLAESVVQTLMVGDPLTQPMEFSGFGSLRLKLPDKTYRVSSATPAPGNLARNWPKHEEANARWQSLEARLLHSAMVASGVWLKPPQWYGPK